MFSINKPEAGFAECILAPYITEERYPFHVLVITHYLGTLFGYFALCLIALIVLNIETVVWRVRVRALQRRVLFKTRPTTRMAQNIRAWCILQSHSATATIIAVCFRILSGITRFASLTHFSLLSKLLSIWRVIKMSKARIKPSQQIEDGNVHGT